MVNQQPDFRKGNTKLLKQVFLQYNLFCDKMLIYDNSITPVLIFRKENTNITIFPNDLWSKTDLQKLLVYSNLS
ncbi:MAG: hypothetical protein FWB84_00015 [Candidatus Bathyarchaeota archaeon]|uniref:hypothetical protein n=1 Tax=Candidatus Bathycorpusculum sp. TaxID=2994959 RepID=UPI00282C381F|nr:hypothetical protein [Candidatus Termiticorpusculum sp.]MCL2256590.1 hypothetical protein [Candidatus Termiticorpusculum sp.]MCL2293212.1 hypothetical protein [Candidatus Termiticorpusculum sp.]